MKLPTINKVVEGILEESEKMPALHGDKKTREALANEACIYLKTAFICENEGLDAYERI